MSIDEQKYMEESWKKESHQSYKSDVIYYSVQDFSSFLFKNGVSGTLLDLGCGNGKNAAFFQMQGFSVLGVDFSKEAIALCNEKYAGSGVQFRVTDILHFSLNKVFDVILDCGCLHHIRRSLWNLYKETILNALAVGGFLYIHGISGGAENKKLPKHPKKRNWIINKKGHYTTFLVKEDVQKLFGSSFELIKTYDFKSQKSPLVVSVFYLKRVR